MADAARYLCGAALPIALAACGGAGSEIASTPTPTGTQVATPVTAPPVIATTPSNVDYDTGEYRRSNAAAQANAIVAYRNGSTGRGVLVGVIDSGVDATSTEFAGRISPLSADYAGSRGIQDVGGHGTAVADVLLGADDGRGVHGVAFDATLLALRTDTAGSCASVASGGSGACSHSDDVIAAALDAAVTARARVVNISLGGEAPNARLRGAIDRATSAGTIIVIAAGNDGVKDPNAARNPDALAQVASDPVAHGLVIVAGAVGADGTLAPFSNKAGTSSANYLTALGVKVQAVDNTGNAYLFDGTSFSAPTIAGAVALLAQAFPKLTPTQLVSLLYASATDLGTTGLDATYGHGELNIARAFQPQGATALANSQVAVSLTNNATLSAAMGDAAQHGLNAVVTDAYGRNFDVNLSGTIRRTARSTALAPSLALVSRTLAATGARTSIALSIENGVEPQRLLLSRGEAQSARVLAGAVAVVVNRNLAFGVGAGRGAEGLAAARGNGDAPAFLIADRSLDRAPAAAFAVRQRLGGIGLRLAAEAGDMRLWQTNAIGPRGDGYRRYPYGSLTLGGDGQIGPVGLAVSMTRMTERDTVLGGRLGTALGGNGAVSWFADAHAGVPLVAHWRLSADLRRGWTQLGPSPARATATLESQALSAQVVGTGVMMPGDSFAVRYAEPLRVTGGVLALNLTGQGTTALSLAPLGRERDWEATYARPLGGGMLTANAYLRRQAGNYALAPDDVGAAVRYSFGF